MANCSFNSNDQLCDELDIDGDGTIRSSVDGDGDGCLSSLPGCPHIGLHSNSITEYLTNELLTPELNKFEPYLWLVAKQDSTHISALTEQIVRGRIIVITEKPKLHLVWAYNRIFIKPLPLYLLSRSFWDYYLLSNTGTSPIPKPLRQDIFQAANGLLRSYCYLIQHESDFVIATDERNRLIPRGISYPEFIRFAQLLKAIDDDDVSPRYQFGELRLTRLNLWYKVFLIGFNYSKVEWQYNAYMARFYAPLLFIFAVFSIVLAAMQVIVAVEDSDTVTWNAYRGFSKFTLYFILATITFLLVLISALFLRELVFAGRDWFIKNYKKRNPFKQKG